MFLLLFISILVNKVCFDTFCIYVYITYISNIKYQFYFKQFSLAWVHSLIQLIQFSISIDFVYTQLNVTTVLYQISLA